MNYKKVVIVMFALLLSLVGCNKLPSDKGSQANGYRLDEEAYQSDEVNNEEDSLTHEGQEQGYQNQNQKSSMPQIYIDYMNEHSDEAIVSREDIAFFYEEDIDLDGEKEAIIAVGIQDEDPLFSQLTYLYVLRNEDNHAVFCT